MSVRLSACIQCDFCDQERNDYCNATQLRRSLRKLQGWRTGLPGGLDMCDECRARHNAPSEVEQP